MTEYVTLYGAQPVPLDAPPALLVRRVQFTVAAQNPVMYWPLTQKTRPSQRPDSGCFPNASTSWLGISEPAAFSPGAHIKSGAGTHLGFGVGDQGSPFIGSELAVHDAAGDLAPGRRVGREPDRS